MAIKKEKYDGRSRPTNKAYEDSWNRIFGKKIKKNEEVVGYYIDGYGDKGIKVLTKKKTVD
jgi:hypothetical protein|tara:strand:+ start:1707 stop:1889 length:183 start_codon:yes stop_codon:yes gene_type:complete